MNEIEIVRWVQGIRFPLLDEIFKLITELGDQLAFIAIALTIYWFFNKKTAFKLVFVFISSAIVNELLKALVMRPRPYVVDPDTNVGTSTHGYAFPSGHAQNTGVITTVLYQNYGKKSHWLKWFLLAFLILVPLSRVYLGQHYPSDIIVGLILGILIAYYVSKLVDKMGEKEHIYGMYAIIPLLLGVLVLSFLGQSYEEVKNLFVALGGLTGFFLGYFMDKKFIQYNDYPKGIKILYRLLIGVVIVMIFYLGLSLLFDMIAVDNQYLDYIRYMFVGFGGSALSMLAFKKLKV